MPRTRFSALAAAAKLDTETANIIIVSVRVNVANLKIVFIGNLPYSNCEFSVQVCVSVECPHPIGRARPTSPLVVHDVHEERRAAIGGAGNRSPNREMGIIRAPEVGSRQASLGLAG